VGGEEMITEILDNKHGKHVSSGKFSISGIGGCLRKKYFEMKGLYKEDFSEQTFRIFSVGDVIHRQICSEFMSKCESKGFSVTAMEVDIPENKLISGRADIILVNKASAEKFVVDVKSCGKWTFDKVLQGIVPQNYQDQVQLYLHFFGIQKGYLLFVNKTNFQVAEAEVIYDQPRCLALIKKVEDFYINNIEKDIAPEKCDGGDFGCEVCQSSLYNEPKV